MSGVPIEVLGNLAVFINGDRGTNYPSKSDFVDHGVPFINAGHLNGGEVDFTGMNYISEERFNRLGSGKTRAGDILYCLRGSLGKTATVSHDGDAAIASSLVIIRASETCDVRFLFRYLTSPFGEAEIRRFDNGSSQPNLSATSVKKYQIPHPPLAEQKRIAGILDAADALRAKRRESLAQLDTLLQSTFLTLFGDPVTNPMGWPLTTLPELSTKFTDGPFGSNLKSSHYVDEGVRVIRLQNIGIGEMIDDDFAFISSDHYDSLPRNHCQPGDVIIGTLGDPNLRACIIPPDLKQSLNKADCLLMRVDESKATNLYACWLLNCPATVAKALELVRGQTRGRISMGRLKELQVPLPPLDLQRRFAAFVESVERQKARLRAHLAELDTLFASLQSRAFNGEL